MTDIIRELREDYPPVDVTTVVFSRDFAGVGCCVIPQDKVLAIAATIDALVKAVTATMRIASDRAAGGRMLTNKEDAQTAFLLCREALALVGRVPETKPAADMRQIFSDGDNTHRWPGK